MKSIEVDKFIKIEQEHKLAIKTIENQSFAASVTESSRNVMSIIFVGVIPIMVVAAGVYVYIRRKNS